MKLDPNLYSSEDPDYEEGWNEDPHFFVETVDVEAAAAALEAASIRLMHVGASGKEWDDLEQASVSDATPNYVSDVIKQDGGVAIWADTKMGLTGPWASRMIAIIMDELDKHGVDGVLTGDERNRTRGNLARTRAKKRAPACRCEQGPMNGLVAGPGGYFCADCGGGFFTSGYNPWPRD